jgi:glycosyltransferase involved in cell wall biosynthesis
MITAKLFPGKLAVQQRVLPEYRVAFFDTLANLCEGGLSVFAGLPMPEEHTTPAKDLRVAHLERAHNRNFLHTTSPFYQCWQLGVEKWLTGWQPDVLIVESNPRTPSTRRAVQWMHTQGRCAIGWGLGLPALHGFLKLWRDLTRRSFLKPLDGMIAYSQRGAQEYRQFGFPTEKVFVAPNAVSPRPTWSLPIRPDILVGKPCILFVGRLQSRKRIDNLLRACAALPQNLHPHIVIVGDGPARNEFEEVARDVYPEAEFTGTLHGRELEEYLRTADLFVLPGTGGLAIQQAMAYGLPVIVAEGDGTQDDLVRPQAGWLVPAGDESALTNTIQIALSDISRLRRMGAEAYRIAIEEVNLEHMAEAVATAAMKILGH